ncbi:DNA cytosine methyltransferase [Alcaligenes nematophilus]|uniref:DNA cytosine methyltransferase n=1 Tax=Alcaligenes nematophilus TaxID=2994643 RepID=UPI002466863C|nr:DNA cytosine methyltransferase [Alcaligenes nematophilus]MDH4868942.1 DNA cytosine methyltransferase [Bacillus cereus]MDY7130260.1 DNA cytosine methyltransferase [Alcaligenes nematophilus]
MKNVIDLFSGVGGLSLGAARAGFNVCAAVELDNHARSTHSVNFPFSKHIGEDISKLSGTKLLNLAGIKNEDLYGLIGGPPCQGFSSMGKNNPTDERNNLFFHFFRLVKETQPKFFLAENVPGIMNTKHDNLRRQAFSIIEDDYIILDPIKAVANDYGAPTTRTRYFFVGFNKKHFSKSDLNSIDFSPPLEVGVINVKKALSGLPKRINSQLITDDEGWKKVDKKMLSSSDWFYHRVKGHIPDNVGDQLTIERYEENHLVSGCMGTRHSPNVAHRYKELDIGKTDPISRSPKLDPNGFCPTLRAGTASDRGSFQAVRPIHFDFPRVITPREAARLQGFPDWFRFHHTKWHSFRQIGNSVSPLVAEAMLSVIYKKIT